MNQLFQKVTQTLKAEVGLKCTEQQVTNKWKSLKRSYKDIQDHNNKSGNDKKTHPFQNELDEIFKQKPTITPVATASSSTSSEESGKECKNEKKGIKRKHPHPHDDKSPEKECRSKIRHTQVSEVVSFLKNYAEKQEKRYVEESNRQERMHAERLSVFKDLIDAMKNK